MKTVLGLDTSYYTTSAAVYSPDTENMQQAKRPLPVAQGTLGLRQNETVFHHVRQLPEVLEELGGQALTAIAASDRPQQKEGSYMPCFLVGMGAARQMGAILGVKVYTCTHQQGHVAAALFGAGRMDLFDRRFLAFHVSGGTTDALLVSPERDGGLHCQTVACSLDLKAGQLIDRVGGMLGLPFPAGPALEKLSRCAAGSYHPRATMEKRCCHLSGVENQCRAMLDKGTPPEDVALFCLQSVLAAVDAMTEALCRSYGKLPLVYAGGVMSNALLRRRLQDKYGGTFAPPAFSADNAAGIAVLGHRMGEGT